jgi:hypothetical protein
VQRNQLHLLPWDDSQLTLYESVIDTVFQQEVTMTVNLYNISTSQKNAIQIPGCSIIKNDAVFLDEGILAVGSGNGISHGLYYFNGSTSIAIDLSGNLNLFPRIEQVNDEVFVIGERNGYMELHRLDEVTMHLTQITKQRNVSRVCASRNGIVYYQSLLDNGVWADDTHFFYGAEFDSINLAYVETLIRQVDSEHQIWWDNPTDFQGALYFTEGGDYDYNPSSSFAIPTKIVRVNSMYKISDIYDMPDYYYYGNPQLLGHANNLYAYISGQQEVFSSQNGLDFSSYFTVPGSGSGFLRPDHYVTENDDLYFRMEDVNGNDAIFQWDQGYQEVVVGHYMDFLDEQDGIMYATEFDFSLNDPQQLILIDTQWNIVEAFDLPQGEIQPIYQSSLIYEGRFTFLFHYGSSIGVLQLMDYPTASLEDLSNEQLKLFPNPMPQGRTVQINASNEAFYAICSIQGEVLKQGELIKGENTINAAGLSAGNYLLKSGNQVIKFVVSQ